MTYACHVTLAPNTAPSITILSDQLIGTLPSTEVRGDVVQLAAADWDQAMVFAQTLLATLEATQPDSPQPGLEGGMQRWADRGPVESESAVDTDSDEAILPHVPDIMVDHDLKACRECGMTPPPYHEVNSAELRERWARYHPPALRQRAKRDR